MAGIMLGASERGHLAELLFKVEALRRGLKVCEPAANTYPYDNVVDNGRTLWRVQVKFTSYERAQDVFLASCTHALKRRGYDASEIDFLAVYLAPVEIWYIVPVAAAGGRKSLELYGPNRRESGIFAAYYEAWHLLHEPRLCGVCLQASAASSIELDAAEAKPPAAYRAGKDDVTLDVRTFRVMNGEDPDGMGIILRAVATLPSGGLRPMSWGHASGAG
jgi:hypothetical protein